MTDQLEKIALSTGLYIVPTPIGNLKDITLRALETLRAVDLIYCEDTRVSHTLLSYYGIHKKLFIYNDFSTDHDRQQIILQAQKKPVALISDAGTPLLCDPGVKLLRQLKSHDVPIHVLPGPCALITAYVGSGHVQEAFCFLGYFSAKKWMQHSLLEMTLIYYVPPHDLLQTLHLLSQETRMYKITLCKELTKHHENFLEGSANDLIEHLCKNPDLKKGEFVMVISSSKIDVSDSDILQMLSSTLRHHSPKDAISLTSDALKIQKKRVYSLYLQNKNLD